MLNVDSDVREALEKLFKSGFLKTRVGELIDFDCTTQYKNEYLLHYLLYVKCVNKIEQLLDTDVTCFGNTSRIDNHEISTHLSSAVEKFLERQKVFSIIPGKVYMRYEDIENVVSCLLELYQDSAEDEEAYDIINAYIENEDVGDADADQCILDFFFFFESAFMDAENNRKLLELVAQILCEEMYGRFHMEKEALLENEDFMYASILIIKEIMFSEDGFGNKDAYATFDVYESPELYTLLKNEEDILLDLCMSNLKSIQTISSKNIGGVIVSDKNETVYLFVLTEGYLEYECYEAANVKLSLFVCLSFLEKIMVIYQINNHVNNHVD